MFPLRSVYLSVSLSTPLPLEKVKKMSDSLDCTFSPACNYWSHIISLSVCHNAIYFRLYICPHFYASFLPLCLFLSLLVSGHKKELNKDGCQLPTHFLSACHSFFFLSFFCPFHNTSAVPVGSMYFSDVRVGGNLPDHTISLCDRPPKSGPLWNNTLPWLDGLCK